MEENSPFDALLNCLDAVNSRLERIERKLFTGDGEGGPDKRGPGPGPQDGGSSYYFDRDAIKESLDNIATKLDVEKVIDELAEMKKRGKVFA